MRFESKRTSIIPAVLRFEVAKTTEMWSCLQGWSARSSSECLPFKSSNLTDRRRCHIVAGLPDLDRGMFHFLVLVCHVVLADIVQPYHLLPRSIELLSLPNSGSTHCHFNQPTTADRAQVRSRHRLRDHSCCTLNIIPDLLLEVLCNIPYGSTPCLRQPSTSPSLSTLGEHTQLAGYQTPGVVRGVKHRSLPPAWYLGDIVLWSNFMYLDKG